MFGRVLNTTLYVVTHIVAIFPFVKPFKCQPHKMVKHSNNSLAPASELFE